MRITGKQSPDYFRSLGESTHTEVKLNIHLIDTLSLYINFSQLEFANHGERVDTGEIFDYEYAEIGLEFQIVEHRIRIYAYQADVPQRHCPDYGDCEMRFNISYTSLF